MSKNDQMGRHPQGEDVCRPMTGAEYLESLRDQREVWIYGERVKDCSGPKNLDSFLAFLRG